MYAEKKKRRNEQTILKSSTFWVNDTNINTFLGIVVVLLYVSVCVVAVSMLSPPTQIVHCSREQISSNYYRHVWDSPSIRLPTTITAAKQLTKNYRYHRQMNEKAQKKRRMTTVKYDERKIVTLCLMFPFSMLVALLKFDECALSFSIFMHSLSFSHFFLLFLFDFATMERVLGRKKQHRSAKMDSTYSVCCAQWKRDTNRVNEHVNEHKNAHWIENY